jgi:ElaB/YqjD/DUF883 family membrane-anchored ribosome-binding protein
MTEPNWDATNGDLERDPEAERIVTEIEITRVDMGATIDEIGHRLQPQTIADEARDKIREATVGRVERIVDDAGQTATQTGNNLVSTIRQNPVPAALAGIGIGWLAMRMRASSGSSRMSTGNGYSARYGSYGYGQPYGGGYGQGSYGQGGFEPRHGSGGGQAEAVRGAADQAASKAQEVGADVQYRAQDALDTVQQGARDVQYQAQSAMSDAQWQLDRTLNENPLALGALAVGVGAAVALAIPSTQKERELIGEQRDKLVEQAAGKVSEAMDQAQEKVQETSEQLTANSNG